MTQLAAPNGIGTVVSDALQPELLDVATADDNGVTGAAVYVGAPGYVRFKVLVENESSVAGVVTITGGPTSASPAVKSFGDVALTADGTFWIEAYVDTLWAQADVVISTGTADIDIQVVEDHYLRNLDDSAAE